MEKISCPRPVNELWMGNRLSLSNLPITVEHFSNYLHMNMPHLCLLAHNGVINDKPLQPDGYRYVELEL